MHDTGTELPPGEGRQFQRLAENDPSSGESILPESDEHVNPEPLALVEARLKELGCAKGSGQDWQCPAHDDEKASLGVTASVDGKVLLNCQAGCTTKGEPPTKVVEALG